MFRKCRVVRYAPVIPLVFDNCLSYEEQLCKVQWKVNEIIDYLSNVEDNPLQYIGSWDSDIEYRINSMVSYDNKIYVAVRNVPTGINIGNTEYWKEIGEFTFAVEEIEDEIDNINDALEQTNDNVTNLENIIEEGVPHANATYHNTIYVAGTTGNDNNDGTQGNPVQTLNRALEIMNKTSSGVYIRFVESGSYTMSFPVISGAMIHFLFDATNVTLYWLDSTDDGWSKCFYSCYINMHGNLDGTSKLYLRGENPAYIEGGKITISNMTVYGPECGFGVVGSAIQSQNNKWHTHVYVSASRGFFQGDTFESVSPYHSSYLHVYNSSDISMRGGVTFKNVNNNAITNIISITASTMRVMQDIILDGLTLADVPIYGASTQFLGGENRLGSWLSTCVIDRTLINQHYYSSATSFDPANP